MIGNRKFTIALVYLALAPSLVWITGDTNGVAAILASASLGVAGFVWGNVGEHKAKNGGGDDNV